ncbi:MAG: site-specific integrase [Pseudomonadota bacterium]
MALTEKRVRDAKPGEKTRIEWDDGVKGFGLRITKAGVKAFVFDYRYDGEKRRMTIGRAGDLTLADARARARKCRLAVASGEDPLREEQARRVLPTVSEALDRFESDYIPRRQELGRMADSTVLQYRRQIARHLRPSLGHLRVRDVTQADIEAMLAVSPEDTRMRERGKTKKGDPVPPVSANRVRALTSKLFRLCEDWGWREQNSNPARAVEKSREEARERTFTAIELAALGRALTESDANPHAILAIRLAALTGLRIGEIRAIRWEHLDLGGRRLVLPQTKTGRRVHTLPSAAVELLTAEARLGPCVIPGRDPDRPLDDRAIRRVFERACASAGIKGVRLHDLRRTVMTQAAATGVGAHLLRDMVGHKTTAMADRYVRQAGEPLIELRERIGGDIAEHILGGSSLDLGGKGKNHG